MARQITLTDEVAALVEQAAERSHKPVDEIANEVLRKAPELKAEPAIEPKPFVVRAFDMGRPLINLDCVGRALEELDELEREG